MGMKFLNKKGWHTGSLKNIENVWKAEQKHEAEQNKLQEIRKQIKEERERADFRQLQVDAGLIPRQERLDFLYESGLAVGKGSSSFQELDNLPKAVPETVASSAAPESKLVVPGAKFEDSKPGSANDAWRKLHSDPLLLIRQREQEALARVKNNPVQMAMIRKSVELKKETNKKKSSTKKHKRKSKHRQHSSSEDDSDSEGTAFTEEKKSQQSGSRSIKHSHKEFRSRDEESSEGYDKRKKDNEKEYRDQRRSNDRNPKYEENDDNRLSRKSRHDSKNREYYSERGPESHYDKQSDDISSDKPPRNVSNNRHRNPAKPSEEERDIRNPKNGELSRNSRYDSKHSEDYSDKRSHISSSDKPPRNESNNKHRKPVKLSEEERAARLREMQMDAEKHEEQRWKRIKKADDTDAQEAVRDKASLGRNFLDAAQKSVYGAEKGGSTTIEESVRRRTHYLQGRSATEGNAFRRKWSVMGCITSKAVVTRSLSIRDEYLKPNGLQSTGVAWEELLTSRGGNDQIYALVCSANSRKSILRTSNFSSRSKDPETDTKTKSFSSLEAKTAADSNSIPDEFGNPSFRRFYRSKSFQVQRETDISTPEQTENKLDSRDRYRAGSRSFHTVEEYDALLERIHNSGKARESFESYRPSTSFDEDQNQIKRTSTESLKNETVSENNFDEKFIRGMEIGGKRKAMAKGLKSLDVTPIEFPTIARIRQRIEVEGQVFSPGTYITPKFGSYNSKVSPDSEESSVFSSELLAAFEDYMEQLQVEEENVLSLMRDHIMLDDEMENRAEGSSKTGR